MNARIWLAALMLVALAQGLAYVFIVPVWQAPDEPMLYEYVALVAELGRVPRFEDRSPLLEQGLAGSLARQRFWHYRIAEDLATPPDTLEGVRALFSMPRQVGGDPPLYFVLAALPLRLAGGWLPEHQVLLLRLLNALLLSCIVACAYGAAREITGDWPAISDDRRQQNRESGFGVWGSGARSQEPGARSQEPGAPATQNHALERSEGSKLKTQNYSLPFTCPSADIPLAAAALVAFHPMLLVIGASLSNDGLANLFGAALCWAMLRLLRCGASARRGVLVAGLLGLGLLTKRTMLPYVPVLLLGLGWMLAGRLSTIERRSPAAAHGAGLLPEHSRNLRRLLPGPASLLVAVLVGLGAFWVSQQFDYQRAAGWTRAGTSDAPVRVWPADRPHMPAHGAALRIATGELDIQFLPPVGADLLRGCTVRFGARIWSDVPARGRLIVYTGHSQHEWPFEIQGGRSLETAALVAQDARRVWFGVTADSGWLYADDLWATGPGLSNNLLLNGGSELPALVPDSPLWELLRFLRLPEIFWAVRSGHIADPLPQGGDWIRVLFVSFWGHFGWMDIAFVFGTLWEPILTLICLAGGLGVLCWLLWQHRQKRRRRQVWALLLLVLVAISLPLINAYTMPVRGALQQGRYLFPVLVPFAILVAFGQSALVPARWQRGWLWLWLGFWLALALAALIRLVVYYHP